MCDIMKLYMTLCQNIFFHFIFYKLKKFFEKNFPNVDFLSRFTKHVNI